ncbi:MAG: hypothetical protein N2317_07940 [Syntrophales bacterium]|nr:hypothetical protein [Syntrophales bacterium]
MRTYSIPFLAVTILFTLFLNTVHAEVKNIFRIGQDVIIDESTRVHHIITINGQITVSGHVDGNIVSVGGSVVLTSKATVEGNVMCIGGAIVTGRGAEIRGSTLEINPGKISDAITEILSEEWEGWSWLWAIFSLLIFFLIFIISLILTILVPRHLKVVAQAIEKDTLRVTLWGLLALILIVPLAALLTVSVVGIVLIPLEIIFVVVASLMGFIAACEITGEWLFRSLKKKAHSMFQTTFWGLLVIWLVGWLPVIGWMVKVLAITIGMGAVIFTRFGTHISKKMKKLSDENTVNI